MSAPEQRTNCPSSETLAAFIDDRLDDVAHRRVIEHLAICDDCRDILMGAAEIEAVEKEAAKVRPFRRRSIWAMVAAIAAAVLIFAVVRPDVFPRDPMKAVQRASANLAYRPAEARLSGFEYRPTKRVFRGPEDDISFATLMIEAEAAKLQENVSRSPSVANLHALGVAKVLLGKPDEAIGYLERAVRAQTDPDARLLNDLSVAYFARAKERRDRAGDRVDYEQAKKLANADNLQPPNLVAEEDYAQALNLAEQAWQIDHGPESAWNRAVAATALDRRDSAKAAWRDYLGLRPEPKWREEAEQKLAGLA